MDKFGYIRGRRGPPGPPGKDAVQLLTWCPKGILEMFRKDEQCTFYFDTAEDGILMEKGKPEKLRDRFGKNNAICLQNFQKPVKIGNYYAIPLEDSLYKISKFETATVETSICIIAFQFRITSELLTDKSVCIWTNETGTRGVTISKKSLNILGTDPLELRYHYRDWNRLVIQYSYGEDVENKCFFELNGRRGFFIPHVPMKEIAEEIYIGGNSKREDFASIVLTNFEVYYRIIDSISEQFILPEQIIEALHDDMVSRHE